jgi:hypothetical protein
MSRMYGRSEKKRVSRGQFVRGAALGGLALAAPGLFAGPASAQTAPDALHRRVRAELKVFTEWLETNGVEGYIGEVGWPDDVKGDHAQWNALAEVWFDDADAANLWVAVWATGEWWTNPFYKLAVYENRRGGLVVDSTNTQVPVVEAHPSAGSYRRGISVCGAEFGTPDPPARTSRFSNRTPGVYDTAYHYESRQTFDYLAGRGVDFVRLAFRWERLQRTPGGELNTTELGRLRDTVARARAAGVDVLLDLHNYGDYYLYDGRRGVRRPIGSAQVTRAHFADVWRRISAAFKADPGVIGYGLMAEPVAMPSGARGWELDSQQAVEAIRANDDGKLVTVSGYEWAGAQNWPEQHPDKWISDPADNHLYEGHHYWDRNNSGTYARTYAEEVANARARGF